MASVQARHRTRCARPKAVKGYLHLLDWLNNKRTRGGQARHWIPRHRIPQRPPKAFKAYLHYVAILELDAISKTERGCAKEVDMQVARAAVGFIFEMMMLDIGKAVTHGALAG